MKTLSIVYLLLLFVPWLCSAQPLFEQDQSRILRVGIIGSGIGGASSAYLLKKNLGINYPNLEIDIYESNNYIGGRVKAVSFKGKTIEVGASSFSPEDRYLQELAASVNLPVRSSADARDPTMKDAGVGIFDGEHPLFVVSNIQSKMSGGLLPALEKFRLKLQSNYNLRDSANMTYSSLEDFVDYGQMGEYSDISARTFAKDNYVNDPVTMFFWGAITRAFYNQGLDVNAFAGLDALLRSGSGLTITGGVSKLVETLIEKSDATVKLDTTVTSISETPRGVEIRSDKRGQAEKGIYDYVIIAAPLEDADIKFTNIENPLGEHHTRQYSTRRSTLVSARGINPSFFKVDSVPDNIMASSDAKLPFSYIRMEGYSHLDQEKIYKVVSTRDISPYIEDMFLGASAMCSTYWGFSNPSMQPGQQYQPTFLSDKVLYLNNIESLVPNLESAAISAKNAVRLLQKELTGTTQPPTWWAARWFAFPLNLLPAIALIGLMNAYLWKHQKQPIKSQPFVVREVTVTDVDTGDVGSTVILERPLAK